MQTVANNHHADISQIAIAWAIGKGVVPLVGVTKVSQIESTIKVDEVVLGPDEMELLERAAMRTGVSIKAGWE
jgi:aryl-alcohol dehydrogenase-like predicted oxidoreductase